MKKIKRVKPPPNKATWRTDFRHMPTGVCIDISVAIPKEGITFTLHKASFVIPMQQIRDWAKDKWRYVHNASVKGGK